MDFVFRLPDLGEGIAEGEVVRWVVREGDVVKEDQALVEVMTDKATVEISSPRPGKVLALHAKTGSVIKVGDPLVTLDVQGVSPGGAAPGKGPAPSKEATGASAPERLPPALAAPAVRQLAKELGLDLASVKGTGPSGRILEEDLRRASGKPAAKTPPAGGPAAAAPREERIPLAGLRRQIAEHLHRSVTTAAHFTYVDEADLTSLVALREQKAADLAARGIKLSYLPFIFKAVAAALRNHPRLNATFDDERQEIVVRREYHLGLATATEAGLVVPVIRDVDRKDLATLAREIQETAERARAGRAQPSELKGGTFTITSLGAQSGLITTPLLNYPECAILAVNRIEPRPVVRGGAVVVRSMAYLSLACDHRVVDGDAAAAFMRELIPILENPSTLG